MEMQSTQPGQNPTQFVFAPPEQDEPSFDYWGVLGRRKWLIFLGLIVGLAAGGFYNSQTPVIYKSRARVRIEPKDPVVFKGLSGRDASYDNSTDFEIRHDQLIGEFNIIEACLLAKGLDKVQSLADIGTMDEKVSKVKGGLTITQNREEQILYEIEYCSESPDDAREILNGLVETYQRELVNQYEVDKKDIKELLGRMNIELSDDYKEKYDELRKVRADFPQIVISAGGLNQYQVKMKALQEEIPRLQLELQKTDADITSASEAIADGVDAANDHVWWLIQDGRLKAENRIAQDNEQQIKRMEDMIFTTEVELQQKKERYGSGHVEVQSMITALESMRLRKAELESEAARIKPRPPIEILRYFIDRNREQMIALRAQIRSAQQELKYNSDNAAKIAINNQRVAELETELARYRERADIAEKQLIEIDSDENQTNKSRGFYFYVTENPSLGVKVWPVLPVILGIGGLFGCLLGFGLGCLVELADKTFHNPDQIIKQLQVPLIGHIPVIGQSKRYLVENSLIEPIVCTYHRPKSQVSEAFRAVRTALYFNTQGKQHSVIQVTSPTPGDGKSTLASNLAVSIAQSGKRVLLVDADMRRPRQHGTFGISSRTGFATVLSGQSEWRDTMFECEEIEGLTVMPCGAKPQNPAELSSSPQVKILIEEMRKEFDFVIIDTPPLLAVTDPCPIAARVDGVVLCLRIKKNVRVSAERAVELIQNLGASCIGLVVNGVGAQSGYGSQYTYGAYRAGYSYNGYGYGYGYGYGGGKYYDDDQQGRSVGPRRLEGQTTET